MPLRISGGHKSSLSTTPPPRTFVRSQDPHVDLVVAIVISPNYSTFIHVRIILIHNTILLMMMARITLLIMYKGSDLVGGIGTPLAMSNIPGQSSNGRGFTGYRQGF
ncbi:hypothetical protein PanWU01x14_050080 [Parasponia andersonii]|uniref:Uncharacterized protein n=1 Tax=Parasponia andersonii TaxID=3476 RepID=A0A2P5DMT4_PARAD|nr:hypothetical protein PanWU01x14_050080 [Parasponia andersonii]